MFGSVPDDTMFVVVSPEFLFFFHSQRTRLQTRGSPMDIAESFRYARCQWLAAESP
jgi:hypothetical protein